MTNDNKCPYCQEQFKTENEKGVHISKNHVDQDKNIPQKSYADDKRGSVLKEYQKENLKKGRKNKEA